MTTSKLTRMAFSAHERFLPINCGTDHRQQEKVQHGYARQLLGALLRQYRVFRLLQEKKRLQKSFSRVAAALGLPASRQQQTEPQRAKLDRIRQIEAELRSINYPQTTR